MGLSISTRVGECLRARPEERLKAREVAEWIFSTYPTECQEKKLASKFLKSDADLLQQLVAEIGANRPLIQKKWPQVRTTAERPRRYFWSEASEEAAVAEAEGASVQPTQPAPLQTRREHDLYPKLTRFLAAEWSLYSKRIDEKTASNRTGPRGNQWLYPDLVAMEDLTHDLEQEVRDWLSSAGAKKVRLWAFEVKLLLNRSNVREAFFQTVSNSSWANFGYLVAADIQGDETVRELRMLAALHGVGVILLDAESPEDESEVLIPARERSDVDWANANRLAAENKDFMSVVKLVRQFHQTGDPRPKDWDQP
jgi:hypothetical protein